MVRLPPVDKPLKPLRELPLPRINTPVVPLLVSVPLPDSVPLRLMGPEAITGLAPNGKLQSLLTVLVADGWVNVTRLKTLLPQLIVAVLAALKFTVPPLALKVDAGSKVRLVPTDMVPAGAVKLLLAFKIRLPAIVASWGMVSAPLLVLTVNVFTLKGE